MKINLSKRGSENDPFSFCETVNAASFTPWHIRQLTEQGSKPGGGADTPALCGRAVSWDLKVQITDHHLGHACKKCAEIYRGQK